MKTTVTLAMAAWAVLPAFAATTQSEIFTYDDIIQSRKEGVSDIVAFRNWREQKRRVQEEKEFLKLKEQRLREEESRLRGTGCLPPLAPEEKHPFAIELAGTYNLAHQKIFDGDNDTVGKINTWGGDITGLYNITPRHAITLRLGYTYGDKSKTEYEETCKDEISSFTLMPGYRYTWHPSSAWSVYAAANIGFARMGVKETWTYEGGSDSQNEHATGFAYTAEVGARYNFSECMGILAACQFGGNNARAKFTDEIESWKSKGQTYTTFRIGLSVRF